MVTAEQVYKLLPPANVSSVLTVANQSTADIINQVLAQHKTNAKQAKKIAYLFDAGTAYGTCKNIWNFLKFQIPYKVEPSDKQTTKTLSRIVYDALHGKGNDCKHYAGFTGAVLDALGYKFKYRFAGYSDYAKYPTHVYCICDHSKPTIIIDAVLNGFDVEKAYKLKIDKNMSLYKLSGVNRYQYSTKNNKQMAGFFDDVWDGIKSGASKIAEGAENFGTWVKKEGGELIDTVIAGGKTATLAVPRNAFLALVALNFRGYATTLAKATFDELVWWRDWFGGDRSKLQAAIREGKGKSRIFGFEQDDILVDSTIGIADPVSVTIELTAAAASIILSIQQILNNLDKKQDAQTTQSNLQAASDIYDASQTFVNKDKKTSTPKAPTKLDKYVQKGKDIYQKGTDAYNKVNKVYDETVSKGTNVLDQYNQAKEKAESYGQDAATIFNLESSTLSEENKKFLQTLKDNFRKKYGFDVEDVLWKKGTDNTNKKTLSAEDFTKILPKDAKKLIESLAVRSGIKTGIKTPVKTASTNNYLLLGAGALLIGGLIYKGKK